MICLLRKPLSIYQSGREEIRNTYPVIGWIRNPGFHWRISISKRTHARAESNVALRPPHCLWYVRMRCGSKWSMAGPQPSLRGRRFPSPSLSNACHAGYPRPNLRSGVIIFIFFFCFLVSLAREGKNNALHPKADYRDKGRGHDRRLSTALFLFLCLKHKHKRKHKKNELVRFSCPYTYAHVDPVFTCLHMCLCLCLRLCLCLVKTRL